MEELKAQSNQIGEDSEHLIAEIKKLQEENEVLRTEKPHQYYKDMILRRSEQLQTLNSKFDSCNRARQAAEEEVKKLKKVISKSDDTETKDINPAMIWNKTRSNTLGKETEQ